MIKQAKYEVEKASTNQCNERVNRNTLAANNKIPVSFKVETLVDEILWCVFLLFFLVFSGNTSPLMNGEPNRGQNESTQTVVPLTSDLSKRIQNQVRSGHNHLHQLSIPLLPRGVIGSYHSQIIS